MQRLLKKTNKKNMAIIFSVTAKDHSDINEINVVKYG